VEGAGMDSTSDARSRKQQELLVDRDSQTTKILKTRRLAAPDKQASRAAGVTPFPSAAHKVG